MNIKEKNALRKIYEDGVFQKAYWNATRKTVTKPFNKGYSEGKYKTYYKTVRQLKPFI